MKKRAAVFVLLAVLTVNAFAETAFDYLVKSLENLLTASKNVNLADFEYDGDNALWGTYLEAGKSMAFDWRYDAGVEYLMLAAAHTKMAEIYLKVRQGQGTGGPVIKKDTAPDPAPMARFKPSVSGWHCFELINESDKPAFVSLIVLKKKINANFSLAGIEEALKNTRDVSRHMASLVPPNSGIPTNVRTLFGGNIREGSAAGFQDLQTAEGNYFLVGAGENSVKNCDVEVIEQYAKGNSTGKKISKNSDSAYPFDYGTLPANASKYYYLKAINKSSRKTGAFILGFLILAK